MARAVAAALMLGQAALSSAFVTSLSSPVAARSVKVGDPGTTTLEMYSLAGVDSEVCIALLLVLGLSFRV